MEASILGITKPQICQLLTYIRRLYQKSGWHDALSFPLDGAKFTNTNGINAKSGRTEQQTKELGLQL
jgi:hypothetical protein